MSKIPSVYQLKPAFQNLLRPLTRLLARIGVSANQITVFAALISVATGVTIYLFADERWPFLLVPLLLFVRMALNAIDGMLAREHGMKSTLGAILNELGDVFADAALYLPFAALAGIDLWLVAIFVVLAVISEMTGVIAIQIGAERRYDGPMGKSDRAAVFGILALVLGLGYSPEPWVNPGLIVLSLLVFATVWNRARRALATANGGEQ